MVRNTQNKKCARFGHKGGIRYEGSAVCALSLRRGFHLPLLFVFLGLLLFIPEIIKLIALIVGYKKVKGNTKADSPKEALPTTPPRGTYDYEYEAVGLYRPEGVAEMPKIGDTLLLAEQSENPYDDKTVVAQRVKDGKIEDVGYMNKGKLRDMVRDFIESETGTVCAIVTRADEKLEVWIGMDR